MSAGYAKKQVVMDEISSELNSSSVTILTEYRGLSMAQLSELRNELYKHDAKFRIVKNTLMKRLIKGTEMEPLGEQFTGPTAIIYGKGDMVAPVKVIRDYLKKNKLDKEYPLKGGFLDGSVVSGAEVVDIANLPSIDELRAKLVGCLAAPMNRLVMALNSQNQALVRTLGQFSEQKQQSESA